MKLSAISYYLIFLLPILVIPVGIFFYNTEKRPMPKVERDISLPPPPHMVSITSFDMPVSSIMKAKWKKKVIKVKKERVKKTKEAMASQAVKEVKSIIIYRNFKACIIEDRVYGEKATTPIGRIEQIGKFGVTLHSDTGKMTIRLLKDG